MDRQELAPRISRCSRPRGGCGKLIAFVRTPKGGRMPVEVDLLGAIPEPTDVYNPAEHVAHHPRCRAFLQQRGEEAIRNRGRGTEQEEGF